jgi:hypothetical protein
MICDAFAFGSPSVMKHYCRTYDFILRSLLETKGNYKVWFEPTLSESFLDVITCWQDNTMEAKTIEKLLEGLSKTPYKICYFKSDYNLNPTRQIPRD